MTAGKRLLQLHVTPAFREALRSESKRLKRPQSWIVERLTTGSDEDAAEMRARLWVQVMQSAGVKL